MKKTEKNKILLVPKLRIPKLLLLSVEKPPQVIVKVFCELEE